MTFATDLELKLELLDPKIISGEEPRFFMSVSNKSDRAIDFLRLDKQNAYYSFKVLSNGIPVEVAYTISDPLSLASDGSDFVPLQPAGVTNGVLSGYSERFSELGPGEYDVFLEYKMSPVSGDDMKGKSNTIRLVILGTDKSHRTSKSTVRATTRP